MIPPLLESAGFALGLGLLVGLQRERVGKPLAGIRTFPLITLFGTLCGALARAAGGLVLAAGLAALVTVIAVEQLRRADRADREPAGSTTEVALLVMFTVGALLAYEWRATALAVTGAVVVLLYAKQPLHRFVDQLGEGDVTAVVRFAIISMIVLPLLPDRPFGPFAVLNPFQTWLMVVLIVGLNLSGYVAYRAFGARAGTLLNGLAGGMVSSTATAAGYARQAAFGTVSVEAAALVIAIASTLVFARVGFEMLLLAPHLGPALLPPLLLPLLAGGLACGLAYRRLGEPPGKAPTHKNPAELGPALAFGALYAVVVFGTAAAQAWYGDRGLYLVALVAGLTDVDAITLSTARLAGDDQIPVDTAWRVVLCAVLANLGFKLAAGAALGGRALFFAVARLFAAPAASVVLLLWLWPG